MKRYLSIAGLTCLALAAGRPVPNGIVAPPPLVAAEADAATAPSTSFAFAQDGGGKLLGKILPPSEAKPKMPESPPAPKPRTVPGSLERPELPLAMPSAGIPLGRFQGKTPLRPRVLKDQTPLFYLQAELEVPEKPLLPSPVLVRQKCPDVNEPLALQSKSQPLQDRASLEDPTAEFSVQQVTNYQPSLRDTPLPFERINLPEPFENRVVAKGSSTEPPVVAPVPTPPK